jgi:hypothetical protein
VIPAVLRLVIAHDTKARQQSERAAQRRKRLAVGASPRTSRALVCKPRRGDTDFVSPLRGFYLLRRFAFRGLAPTAKLFRRCATLEGSDANRAVINSSSSLRGSNPSLRAFAP